MRHPVRKCGHCKFICFIIAMKSSLHFFNTNIQLILRIYHHTRSTYTYASTRMVANKPSKLRFSFCVLYFFFTLLHSHVINIVWVQACVLFRTCAVSTWIISSATPTVPTFFEHATLPPRTFMKMNLLTLPWTQRDQRIWSIDKLWLFGLCWKW